MQLLYHTLIKASKPSLVSPSYLGIRFCFDQVADKLTQLPCTGSAKRGMLINQTKTQITAMTCTKHTFVLPRMQETTHALLSNNGDQGRSMQVLISQTFRCRLFYLSSLACTIVDKGGNVRSHEWAE